MIAELSPQLFLDSKYTVLHDFSDTSDTLLIVFSGVGQGIGVPYFEFLKSLSSYPIHKIFIRDIRKSWYHGGIQGVGDTIDETIKPLQEIMAQSGASRVITLGNSMGGYAAILFGALLKADEVLAFAPTTFASWKNRLRYWDMRGHFKYLRNASSRPYHYYDLRNVPNIDKPQIKIFFDTSYRPDRHHAEHLGLHLHNVELVRFQGGKHKVIRNMKDSGDLEAIFAQKFA